MKEKIINLIREAVNWEVDSKFYDVNKNLLDYTADLARLMIDIKKDNISMESMDFLLRMNISPTEFSGKKKEK